MPHCAFYTVGCWRIISEAANLTTNPKLASLSLSHAPCLPASELASVTVSRFCSKKRKKWWKGINNSHDKNLVMACDVAAYRLHASGATSPAFGVCRGEQSGGEKGVHRTPGSSSVWLHRNRCPSPTEAVIGGALLC